MNTGGSHSLYLSRFERGRKGPSELGRKRIKSLVNWHSWGEEAIQEAKHKKKPIFLSIGSSSSYWCHVMDVKTFNHKVVAKLLNDTFVCIKVDRDEHPHIAKEYIPYMQIQENTHMRYLDCWYLDGYKIRFDEQKSKSREIWPDNESDNKQIRYHFDILDDMPLNVFLSFDLEPFDASFYYPLGSLLFTLSYYNQPWLRKKSLSSFDDSSFDDFFNELPKTATSPHLRHHISRNALYLCAEKLLDVEFGASGFIFKFPSPVRIHSLLYHSKTLVESGEINEANKVLDLVLSTLACMANSGLHDHLGGGFHRIGSRFRNIITPNLLEYSAKNESPPVPHFEKMLYDQGQLASVYLDAFSITKDRFCSCVSREILDFLRRSMKGRDGGFFSAVVATTNYENGKIKEGAFYQWTDCEVDRVLKCYAKVFWRHYELQPLGTGVHNDFKGKHVLKAASSYAAIVSESARRKNILGKCRKRLLDWKSRRLHLNLDETVIVSWNGLVISSFARASKILKGGPKNTKFNFPASDCDPEEYLEVAEKAAQFITDNLYKDEDGGELLHSFWNIPSKVPGFLDDYAFLISGLLDLYEFGGGHKWLKWAIKLQDIQDKLFLDEKGGGYYYTPKATPHTPEDTLHIQHTQHIHHSVKEYYDGAVPSGNSVSAINLMRLSSMFWRGTYKRTAEHLLAVFEMKLKEESAEVPLMCCAADMLAVAQTTLVVLLHVGPCVELNDMLSAAHAYYDQNKTVIHIDVSDDEYLEFWRQKNPVLAGWIETVLYSHVSLHPIRAAVFRDTELACMTDDPLELIERLSMMSQIRNKERDLAPCGCSCCEAPPPQECKEECWDVIVDYYHSEDANRYLEQIKGLGAQVEIVRNGSKLRIKLDRNDDKFGEAKAEIRRSVFQIEASCLAELSARIRKGENIDLLECKSAKIRKGESTNMY